MRLRKPPVSGAVRRMRLLAALAFALAAPAAAQDAPEPRTPASVIAEAPAADWRAIDPADLLVMTLAPDRDGNEREVVIQLIPPPFSQPWVENIRTLAKAHWWDGTSVYRVVDNWVAQWGDGEDDERESKPLPEGVVSPEAEYESYISLTDFRRIRGAPVDSELTADLYSRESFFFARWPFGSEFTAMTPACALEVGGDDCPTAKPDSYLDAVWPIHCYGYVGVARDLAPDTGTGSELYAVIGHAPRQLDRNIAVVGRVIEGIEHLSILPRGTGEAGVYDDPALRVPIVSVRLGDEIEEFPPPRFEYLASDSESFARYVHVRANRSDAFYKVPAGGIDVCNVQVPIRRVPSD